MTPAWTLISAFAGAILMLVLPSRFDGSCRWVALLAAGLGALSAGAGCLARLMDPEGAVWSIDLPWIPALGSRFHLAADGLSLVLLFLTGLTAMAGVLFSWKVEERPRSFFACFLMIIGGVHGVFLSRDVFLLFVFYEVVILPKFLMIAIWGSKDRDYAAMKLTMYSIGSSALILSGLVIASSASGTGGYDLRELAAADYDPALQVWAFPLLFGGFAVLAGMWPFHTWAPTGHAAAPTAASMLLAGVVMKLGAYGALRVAMPLFEHGFVFWQPVIAILASAGILHGAFTALRHKDLKLVIGYSSVSHMGFILLGLSAGNVWGLRGAVLQMISHGLIAGLLFGIVGGVVYERTHTRDLRELGALDIWNSLPGASIAFILASAASMGLPGFSGFVAEIAVILGIWPVYPWLCVAILTGIIATAAFSLRMIHKGFLPVKCGASSDLPVIAPLSFPEIAAIALLLAGSISIGLHPRPWVNLVDDGLPELSTPTPSCKP